MSEQKRVREHLESTGFNGSGGTLTATFPVSGDRTQVVWVEVADQVKLASPIVEGIADSVPEWLAEQDYGRYAVAAHTPYVTVGLTLDLSVSEELLDREAALLAQYADDWEKALTPDRDVL